MRLDAGEAYVADTSSPDDYRCFLVGEVLEEDLYIKALGVDPDQDSIVHHVLIYAVDPEEVAKVEGKNANEEGLGYTCFGGPGASNPSTLFAWAPGGVPLQLPDGAAIKVDKGSRLVMQLHYNLAYLGADETPPADKSAALVWTMAADEAPDKLVRIVPFADLGLSIEAGDADAFNERDFLLPYTSTIIGVVPHMHVLGTAIRSEHIDPDGETTCLVDIPEWDFNWQQFYLYDEAQYVAGDAGDIHRVSCSYDNSQANQPIINGEQQPPQDVEWGDGTFDEMCLSYLVLMTAFDIDGGVCNGLEACSQTCDAGDFLCFLGCTLVPGATCIQCVGTPLIVDCGNAVCPDEAAEAIGCFTGHDACADDPLSCLTDTCLSELNTLYGCLHEPVQQGQCNDILAECDVSF